MLDRDRGPSYPSFLRPEDSRLVVSVGARYLAKANLSQQLHFPTLCERVTIAGPRRGLHRKWRIVGADVVDEAVPETAGCVTRALQFSHYVFGGLRELVSDPLLEIVSRLLI